MGLKNFIKNIGKKLAGVETETKELSPAEILQKNASATLALKSLLAKMALPIENLNVIYDQGKVTLFGKTESQETSEKAELIVGNTQGVSEVDNNIEVVVPQPEAVFHTVVKGEYLSKIAKQYYGNANRYMEIFEANKPMLKDPDEIYPGQVLRIPNVTK